MTRYFRAQLTLKVVILHAVLIVHFDLFEC